MAASCVMVQEGQGNDRCPFLILGPYYQGTRLMSKIISPCVGIIFIRMPIVFGAASRQKLAKMAEKGLDT